MDLSVLEHFFVTPARIEGIATISYQFTGGGMTVSISQLNDLGALVITLQNNPVGAFFLLFLAFAVILGIYVIRR